MYPLVVSVRANMAQVQEVALPAPVAKLALIQAGVTLTAMPAASRHITIRCFPREVRR